MIASVSSNKSRQKLCLFLVETKAALLAELNGSDDDGGDDDDDYARDDDGAPDGRRLFTARGATPHGT